MIEIMGDSLQQWEQGRKVVVKCEAPYTEVQFAHAYDKEALIVELDGNEANIPNILLQSNRALCVYLVHKTAEEERVLYTKTFTVGARPKPSDYAYTETEVKNYEALKKRIETLEKNGASDEVIESVIKDYLEENPIETGATKEQIEQIEKNTRDIANKANVIVDSADGNNIVLTDSANEKPRGMKLFGKSEQPIIGGNQLLQYPFAETTKTMNGVTFVDEGDGWISVSGTSTGEATFKFISNKTIDVIDGEDVTVSIETIGSIQDIQLSGWDFNWGTFFTHGALVLGATITTQTGKISSNKIQLQLYTKNTGAYYNCKIRIMVNKGSIALPYEPYLNGSNSPIPQYPQEITSVGDGGSVEVGLYGANLLDSYSESEKYAGHTKEMLLPSGVYYYKYHGEDGTQNQINKKILVLINDEWVLIHMPQQTPTYYDNGNIYVEGRDMGWQGIEQKITFKKPYYIRAQNYGTKLLTLSVGNYLPNFVPYVEKRTLTLNTPNGLRGIKVSDSSLANYTDADGNMWCCDEIDLERGKFVQRVVEKVLDGSEVVGWGGDTVWHMSKNALFGSEVELLAPQRQRIGTCAMCNTFVVQNEDYNCKNMNTLYYSTDGITFSLRGIALFETFDNAGFKKFFSEHPTTIYAILKTPIETDLADITLPTMNYPTTTLISDAHLHVDYVADTKGYIDKKFAEIAKAIV